MKAIIYQKYGSPDNLVYADIEAPVPRDNEVLIKVHASSINSWDWDLVRGRPFISRLGGILKPKYNILGADVAGKVVTVGSRVASWKVGDAVYGDISECGWGGFAEYAAIKADSLARKPENLTFEQAASIPQAGLLAWSALQMGGWPINPRKKILLNGAGGAVGTFAIQIAKHFGAEVTAVDKTGKIELMQNLGADHTIDFTTNDFTQSGNKYDLIVDVVAYRPLSQYRNTLEAHGSYVAIGGTTSAILRIMFGAPLLAFFEKLQGKYSGKQMSLLIHRPDPNVLDEMRYLLDSGNVKPTIDRVFPLKQTPAAMHYFGEGNVKGKIVIKVA